MLPDNNDQAAQPADIETILAQFEKLPDKADVHTILNELEKLRCDVTMLRDQPSPPMPKAPAPIPVLPPAEQLVPLDQIGAMVYRSNRSMERYPGRMPPPRVRGRRGQPHLGAWSEARPWLGAAFGLQLPEHFVGHTT